MNFVKIIYLTKQSSHFSTDLNPEINADTVAICESMSDRCASTTAIVSNRSWLWAFETCLLRLDLVL